MANANLDDWILHRNFDEDAYTGMLMVRHLTPSHPIIQGL